MEGKHLKKRILHTLQSCVLPLLFLVFWHTMAVRVGNSLILPDISDVLEILMHPTDKLIGVGSILYSTYVSMLRVLCGYAAAVILAVPLGIIIGYNKRNERFLLPFLSIFRSIPPVAWVSLVLAWFGIASLATVLGIELTDPLYKITNNMRLTMIFIIFVGSFFPILSNTIYGMQTVRKTLLDSAKSMGATTMQLLTKVYLPHALPSIFTGLQVGLGSAWMTLICAEMLPGSVAGVGYMISHAYQVTRVDVVIAGMISIGLVGFLIDQIFVIASKYLFKWQRKQR